MVDNHAYSDGRITMEKSLVHNLIIILSENSPNVENHSKYIQPEILHIDIS
eukprot:Gb_18448 [translate_table: standard]